MHSHYNRLFIWSISIAFSKNVMLLDWQPDRYSTSAPVWLHQDTRTHSSQTDWKYCVWVKFYPYICFRFPPLLFPESVYVHSRKWNISMEMEICFILRGEVRWDMWVLLLLHRIFNPQALHWHWHKNSSSLLIWVQFSCLVVIWFM